MKDMEYYYYEDKVEKIKAKAMKSKDIKHIDQCIKELISLYKELDQSKDNKNYEAFDLVNDACRKLNEYKKTLEK